MRETLKKLLGGWLESWRNRGARRLGMLDDLSDTQLRDIGFLRRGERSYRNLREPPSLNELFPKTGGMPAGEKRKVKAGPTQPLRRKTKQRHIDA